MNEKPSKGEEQIFVCHFGLERSKAAAEALNDAGVLASHFPGGTRKLTTLSKDEIVEEFGKRADVVLIYDPGSKDGEFERKEEAVSKLKEAGIDHRIIGLPSLTEIVRENGKDLNDYLF